MNPSTANDTDALLAEAGFVQGLARALVRDAALADDISQDVMAVALQQPEPPRNWRHWLATVTRRMAAKAHLARANRTRHEGGAGRGDGGETQQHTQDRLQLQRDLTEAVMAMPEPYRTVVTLRFLEGLPPRVIAQRTGTKSGTVRQRLMRGLAMLRERLDRDYGSRRAWLTAFAALGFPAASAPVLTLSAMAMNKLALAACAAIVGGTIFLMTSDRAATPTAPPMPRGDTPAESAQQAAHARGGPTTPERTLTTSTTPRCIVHVTDTIGRAMPATTVHCWQSDGSFQTGTTDVQGDVSFAGGGAGGLLALHGDYAPTSRELDEREGTHELALAEGRSIAGTLWVDGQLAPPGTQLLLLGEGAYPDHVPPTLSEHLRWQSSQNLEVVANGRFERTGLPADWSGSLRMPRNLWVLPESGGSSMTRRRFHVDAPRRDIDLKTVRLPRLAGSVVWDDTGEAVPDPIVWLDIVFSDGERTPMHGAGGNEHGEFWTGAGPSSHVGYRKWCDPDTRPQLVEVTVNARAKHGEGQAAVTFAAQQFAAGPVTVRLRRADATHFLALDETGAPIEGARVLAAQVSAASAADGHGSFAGKPEQVRQIGAPGFRTGPASPRDLAKGTRDDPLVYVLQPDNSVTIHLVDADGGAVTLSSLGMQSEHHPFAGGRMQDDLDRELHGDTISMQMQRQFDTRYEARLPWPAEPRIVLHSLEPGIPATLTAIDGIGTEVASVSFVTPEFGEHREATLQVKTPARSIVGRFVDESGAGIARVDVHVGQSVQRTDGKGRLHIEPVCTAEPLPIIGRAAGFVALRSEIPPGDTQTPLVWTMQRAQKVTVRIVDEQERPITLPVLADGIEAEQQPLAEGVTQFDNLPAGKVVFVCKIGAIEFRTEHDTSRPELLLRVPTPARLVVRCANDWPPTAARVNLVAIAHRLDARQEPSRIWRPRDAKPALLVPGRYRIDLIEQHGYGEEAAQVPLGLATEITLTANEQQTATLR